jgi:hypothetical protein
MARLVNRFDAWGGFYEDFSSGERQVRKVTKPALVRRGRVRLTEITLAAHFRAYRTADLLGLHTTSASNMSLWAAAELDHHGPTSTPPELNLRAVLGWYGRLRAQGFRPLLTDSNGKGGYHLLTLFSEPTYTGRAYDFLQALVADYRRHGLDAPPEVFPKQRQVPAGGYGNWLRVVGKHHTEPHWSRVWAGSGWLAGADAVAFILSLEGDPVSLLPPARPEPPVRNVTARRPMSGKGSGNLSGEIAEHLGRFPSRAAGQDRDTCGFAAAAYLVADKRLDDDTAREWLRLLDARNTPPKGEDAIEKWIRNAKLYARNRDKEELS